MSLFSRAHNPGLSAASPPYGSDRLNNFWYSSDLGGSSSAGIAVGDETIKKCAIALNALRWLTNAVATCADEPIIFPASDDRIRKKVPRQHYLRRLLRRPNARQHGHLWVQYMTWNAALYGNAYSEIKAKNTKQAPYVLPIGKLEPLDPRVTRPIELSSDGELIYQSQRFIPGTIGSLGPTVRIDQGSMFHVRGVTSDGIVGEPINALIRNVIGIAVAAEQHTATYLRKGARLSGMIVTSGPMTKDKRDELRESVNSSLGGVDNTGTLGILPYGTDIKPISANNREGQLLELREYELAEVLRALGVPGIVVGYSEKTQGYASAKEFFESGGLKHCVLPWLKAFETQIESQLVMEDEDLDVEFDMDVLTRPDTWARIEALTKASGRAFITGNEARVEQGMSPIKDESMDKVTEAKASGGLEAQLGGSKGGAPKTKPGRKKDAPAPSDDKPAPKKKASVPASGPAALLAAVEIADLMAKAPKYAKNSDGWRAWVAKYYNGHAQRISDTLAIPLVKAQVYCLQHAAIVSEEGIAQIEAWSGTIPALLEAMTENEEAV